MTITLKKKPIKFDYHIDSCVLDHVSHIKDLGIILDSRLSFVQHIDYIVGKANRMVGLIKRNFNIINNVTAIRLMFLTLVRPILEYNTVIFNSISDSQANRIESIQKRFLRYLHHKQGCHAASSSWCDCDYVFLSNLFNIQPLYLRRKIFDLFFCQEMSFVFLRFY